MCSAFAESVELENMRLSRGIERKREREIEIEPGADIRLKMVKRFQAFQESNIHSLFSKVDDSFSFFSYSFIQLVGCVYCVLIVF